MPSLGRPEYKYIVAAVSIFGLFMNLLDMTIIHVAIPTLAAHFETSTSTVGWVITGYGLSLAVFVPVSGWAGDRFGLKRTFTWALGMFTAASLLCALSWNIESLIAFRLLQGVGGGLLTPVGTTLVFRAFPPSERSRASALILVPTTIAPASGPILGGYLVEYLSWRWIFLVNLPVGIAGVIAATFLLRELREDSGARLDVRGLALAITGLPMLFYALARAGTDGIGDAQVILFGVVGVVLVASLVMVEARTPHALVAVTLFKSRLFSACNAVAFVGMTGVAGAMFLLPVLLQSVRGFTPLESGLTTFPQAIGVMTIALLAGRLYNSVGPRRVTAAALVLGSAVYFGFFRMDLGTSEWAIRGLAFLSGWSFGLMQVSLQAATFASVPVAQTGRASAIANSVRQLGMAFGVALAATLLSARLRHHDAALNDPASEAAAMTAFQDVFLALIFVAALGALLAATLMNDRVARAVAAGPAAPPVTKSPP
jgi:EmrB/QacA subfamily drug resistance transporter